MKIDEIKVGNTNVRKKNRTEDLEALINSIKSLGLINPIEIDEEGKVISGSRRLAALKKLAKDKEVKVVDADTSDIIVIRRKGLSNIDKILRSLAENVIRKDLTLEDICNALSQLVEELGSIEKVAEVSGLSPATIRHLLASKNLMIDVKKPKMKKVEKIVKKEEVKREEIIEDTEEEEVAKLREELGIKLDEIEDELEAVQNIDFSDEEEELEREAGKQRKEEKYETEEKEESKPRGKIDVLVPFPARIYQTVVKECEKEQITIQELILSLIGQWLVDRGVVIE